MTDDPDTHPDPSTTPSLTLSDAAYKQAQACIHCGLCLPACPTYVADGLEADSPRGRIHMMKTLADGGMPMTDGVVRHLNQCLDCRACEPACPSGVVYHRIIEEAKPQLPPQHSPTTNPPAAVIDWLIRHVFAYPRRLRLALAPVKLLQRLRLWPAVRWVGECLPGALGRLPSMLPDDVAARDHRLAARYAAEGERRMTVGLLSGCVGSVLVGDVHDKAIALLRKFGCELVVPEEQVCCGAVPHHAGDPARAREMAERNIEAFDGVDRIVTDIAGCGAMLKDVAELFEDDAVMHEKASVFSKKVRDVHELIVELDPPPPPRRIDRRVTYHEACHLVHAQRAGAAVRDLLNRIEGLRVEPLVESDLCCGAAGSYSLQQPEMARTLGRRKVGHIRATDASTCVTANIGCAMQILSHARDADLDLEVMHPIDLIHEAYLGEADPDPCG